MILELCDKDIYKALNDEIKTQPAVVMHLIVCYENIEKNIFVFINTILDKQNLQALIALKIIRNTAINDYKNLNFKTIHNYLPKIKDNIKKYLDKQSIKKRKK
ncbi:hypothetical protein FMM58_00930 [Campylobacter sp. LR291e]|uniref:hypothetical protein n=1 Tax=Campylobacter sp. LR291e TaxID=2593546 RepID=UPI00123B3428|nr:hypothetical protein [Campylobacter sp. LR291e]KAA6234085.1 hypothetical protein FMM58_00930 [Campylobacter sp. LR291e]